MRQPTTRLPLAAFTLLLLGSALPAPGAAADPVALVAGSPGAVYWQALVPHDRLVLTVATPDGAVLVEEFQGGETPFFSLVSPDGYLRPDGDYAWELRVVARVSPSMRQEAQRLRELSDHQPMPEGFVLPGTPDLPWVQSGSFRVERGELYGPWLGTEEPEGPSIQTAVSERSFELAPMDQVINDNLIVTGRLCAGNGCADGEDFLFTTLKLKHDNIRQTFIDMSTASGFPSGDWQLRANDSTSGGADHFSIDWLGTEANVGSSPVSTPFRVDGGAPNNSIRVASSGRVGFRTASPVLDLHVATGDSPGLRLEQTGASGFTPQTWDIAGNEANFFVRDVTGGSSLPFRIRPGAPTSSLDIAANGNVGIGTSSPQASLHVQRSTGTAGIRLEDTSTGSTWDVTIGPTGVFTIGSLELDPSTLELGDRLAATPREPLGVDPSGNVRLGGTVSQASSREVKVGIEPIDGASLLASVRELDLAEWTYRRGTPEVRHVGPMAEDFHRLFGYGADPTSLAPSDLAGVALAAAQELARQLEERDARIVALEERLEALEGRLPDSPEREAGADATE